MASRQVLLVLFAFVALAASSKLSYDGHEVWRLTVEEKNPNAADAIQQIIDQFDLDVWASSALFVDVRIPPELVRTIRVKLAGRGLQWRKMIPDLSTLIKAEAESQQAKPYRFSLDKYNTFEEIQSYLQNVSLTNKFATLQSLGKSVERRDIWQLKLSVGSGKPAVWVDCEIHAREWISGATCLYGINHLLTSYGINKDVTTLLNKYDVFIIPVLNPDGYVYSWTTDRMWRKNRNHYKNDRCYGIDLNRNFDDNFGEVGSTSNSCSDSFMGPSPASEPETKVIQTALQNMIKKDDLNILFTIHSYSQLWMYPYGYTDKQAPNAKKLDQISKTGVKALRDVYGTKYNYGPIATTIYPASGDTIDYSYDQGIAYSFALELRDTGTYGFLLPENQITPTGKETWAGIIAAILAI